MRRAAAAVAGVTVLAAVSLSACGGGSAQGEETGAQKAACKDAPNFALASYHPAALPPEPVQDLLPKAKFIVEARVSRVLYRGEKPPEREGDKNTVGPIPPDRCQVVRLDITSVMSGADPGSSLTVVKPLAPYVLKAGQRTSGVAFLVEGGDPYPVILGRYGPYPVDQIQAALAARH